jgi:hypothetical protein
MPARLGLSSVAVALLVSITGIPAQQAQAASRDESPALLARGPASTALNTAPSTAGTFGAVSSIRVLDTRYGVGAAKAPVRSGGTLTVKVTGVGGVPATGVSAVVVNVVATAATKPGYLTGWANGATRPHTSILNFGTGQAIANEVVLPVGADGKIALYNGAPGTVQIVADLAGYYRSGAPSTAGTFGVLRSTRVLDTRYGIGAAKAPLTSGATRTVKVTGIGGVPATGVSAVVVNVVATAATKPGYLTGWASGASRPYTSILNFGTGQAIANEVVLPVGADGKIALYNGAPGTVQIVADLAGYYRTAAPLPWSGPQQVVHKQSGKVAVSCATANFCMAVDTDGNALSWNGTAWSTPQFKLQGGGAEFIDCPSITFCLAVQASQGTAYIYRSGTWTQQSPQDVGEWVDSMSCASATLCVLVRSGITQVFNGSSWTTYSGHTGLPAESGIHVSCATNTFCVAVGRDGAAGRNDFAAHSADGATWIRYGQIGSGAEELYSVSCVSAQFCMAGIGDGKVTTFNGTTWSAPQRILATGGPNGPLGIICVSTTFCLANNHYVYDGTSWSGPITFAATKDIVTSCGSPTFCVAFADDGDNFRFNGATWSGPTPVLPYQGILRSLSCPSISFCMAVDGSNTYTYDGSSWSAPMQVTHDSDSSVGPGLVSCTSASFCVAVPLGGSTFGRTVTSWTWDGTAWTPHAVAKDFTFMGLSCVSPTFCLGITNDLVSYIFDGTGWSAGPWPSTETLNDVSCAAASFCLATDGDVGSAFIYNGTTWSLTPVSDEDLVWSLSCPSTTFCMVPDSGGVTHTYNGATWSSQPSPTAGVGSLSCTSSTFCAGFDGKYSAAYDGTSWGSGTTLEATPTGGVISCAAARTCVVVDWDGRAFHTPVS